MIKQFYSVMTAVLLTALNSFAFDSENYSMASYTLSPADGSTVPYLETVTVKFPNPEDGIELHIMASNVGNYCTLTQGTKVYKAIKCSVTGDAYDTFSVTFPKISTAGDYTLNISDGVVYDYDQAESADEGEGYSVNPPITATYTVKATTMNVYTLTPADGAELTEFGTFTINFPETGDGIDVYGNTSNITLTCGDDVYHPAPTSIATTSDYKGMTFSFRDITKSGVYTLCIPADTFKDYETEGDMVVTNPEITATYTLKYTTGVESVAVEQANDANGVVVDIFGRVRRSNVGADALNGLTPGLYIVNGKKMVVK
jgi:hypothetical protein